MRSITQRSFWEAYQDLPNQVSRQAREAYRFFLLNPNHPGLEFKRVSRRRPVYSVRIGMSYRPLRVLEQGDIIWFWIGHHHQYDRVIRQL